MARTAGPLHHPHFFFFHDDVHIFMRLSSTRLSLLCLSALLHRLFRHTRLLTLAYPSAMLPCNTLHFEFTNFV
jgi:hypothetical protein